MVPLLEIFTGKRKISKLTWLVSGTSLAGEALVLPHGAQGQVLCSLRTSLSESGIDPRRSLMDSMISCLYLFLYILKHCDCN